MSFQIGDKVVHWAYGMGEIISLDEKELSGKTQQYYVVEVNKLTLWVPIERAETHSLRLPTPSKEFEQLFDILSSTDEILPDDRYQRQSILSERMRSGNIEAVCSVIRDLSARRKIHKLNENDQVVLQRAEEFLFDEWTYSMHIPLEKAQQTLEQLLDQTL